MLSPSQLRSLISVQNIRSGLLAANAVKSVGDFEAFKDITKGIPVLIPADESVFDFDDNDVFYIDSSKLSEIIYGGHAETYIGFKTAFTGNAFLSSYRIKQEFVHEIGRIQEANDRAAEHVEGLRRQHKRLGAFQTRNIPHYGHQKIMERLLERCDHLVVNPVLGPKKPGDATIECLSSVFGDFFKSKFNGRISFMPVFANMYYAGPREAIHHAIIRRNMGFTNFSVGRDHAGAEGFYDAELAPKLMLGIQDKLNIDVFCHMGAKHCAVCGDFVIADECGHAMDMMRDVAGSQFREAMTKGQIFEFADKAMQEYVFKNVKNIFEV